MHTASKYPFLIAGAAFCLLAAQPAGAHEYSALIKAKKYPEAEKAATARLAQEPRNAEAMIGKTEAILGAGAGRIEEAVRLGEQCVAANPDNAGCHLALGKALGAKAMTGGLMSAMKYVGTIRDSFKKAVELEPRNMDARFSLLQFYVMAPGIAGGGIGKAETLAAQTAGINPEAGKLMTANIDAAEGRLAKAEAGAAAARPGADEQLQERQEDVLIQVGARHVADKKFADGERIFRNVQKRFPDSEKAPYSIARVQQEQGKHREALAGLEQLAARNPRAPTYYRIGQSAQALGDKARAAMAFEKALSFKTLAGKLKSDAEDQLKSLKG